MAPIGILTAVVSAVRVCGHSSLRAFIGRSQEGDGIVEAELCTSTSRDVCELFNRGGITRVLGRPSILELVYIPHSSVTKNQDPPTDKAQLYLLRNYLETKTAGLDHSWWQREEGSWFGKAKNHAAPRGSFAPNPNLSINVGIVKQPRWVFYTIATIGLILQAGVLALAGAGAWFLRWNLNGKGSSASRNYAPAMFIAGTVLMCGGMWSCAALIGQTTYELRYRRRKPRGSAKRPRLLWLQPGPQVIGDQSFDPFAYFENTDVNPLQVWTSSKKDFDEKFEVYTLFAVLAVLIGYVMQFIGLRGMKAWVSLAQLGITATMSILRGCLRMQRLSRNDNKLLTMPDMVTGHELDWLSFEIVREKTQEEPSLHVAGKFEEARGSGMRENSSQNGFGSCRPSPESRYVQSPSETHPAPTSKPRFAATHRVDSNRRLDCRDLLQIRKRLAHLTGHIPFSEMEDSEYQKWKDSHVKVRAKARTLSAAISLAAEDLQKRRQWKNQSEVFPQKDQQKQGVTLQIQAAASPDVDPATSHEQLISIILRPPPDASQTGWRIDSAQLEAILGLWMWTLVSDKSVVSEDDSSQKLSGAEGVQCARIVSANPADNSWDRDADKQGEMDLWLGSNAVTFLKGSLTLNRRSYHGIASLWVPDHENNWKSLNRHPTSKENPKPEMRFCGWNSVRRLPRPVASGQQADQQAKLQIQHTSAGGSLLDICAQELFASLMMSLTDILNVEKTTIVENAGLTQLENPTVTTFTRAFVERHLGSYSDALLCLVPAFRSRFPLPSSEDMLSALLKAAETYRKAGQGTDHVALGIRASLARALRATGELYRWSLARWSLAQDSSDERKRFAKDGIAWMKQTYSGDSNQDVAEIVDIYHAIAARFPEGSSSQNSLRDNAGVQGITPTDHSKLLVKALRNGLKSQSHADEVIDGVGGRAGNREEALYHLCFITTGAFGSEDLQAALPLAVRNDWSEVVSAILDMKANPNSGEDNRTAISYSAELGYELYVKPLIDLGASLDLSEKDQRTPLFWSAQNGHANIAELLLNTGYVDPNRLDVAGRTPLWMAAAGGHEAVVKLLFEKGADLESKGQDGLTPLSMAAAGGHEAVVKLLLEGGADLESKGQDGSTPLWRAAAGGHEAVVKLLFEKGADLESKGQDSLTPLWMAAVEGHEAVVKLLLEGGADLESNALDGSTPLSMAAVGGHEAVVKLLLEKGADLESKVWDGSTPLSRAAAKGHEAVVKLLQSHPVLSL
ncbi:MAG: hypothetical protein M1840_005254 [Geoglossum simile]|nr:MAG: hypothetical protein M1840_005254 [Geoglossum simile]